MPRDRRQAHRGTLRSRLIREPPHDGPFSVGDIRKVFERCGLRWIDGGESDQVMVYGDGQGRSAYINPTWESIFYNDAIFRTLARDLGLSPRRFRRLLCQVQ